MTEMSDQLGASGLFPRRVLVHAVFWLSYYLLFSVIWASPERGYFASFYLEFVLMPLRILASYCMMYALIPTFFDDRNIVRFITSYLALILVAGGLQLLITQNFYDRLLPDASSGGATNLAAWMRNVVLINTTVILLGAVKVIKLHFQLLESLSGEASIEPVDDAAGDAVIEVRSNRRVHRLRTSDILFVEAMGNYIRYVTNDGGRTIVYSSLKAAQAELPDRFLRVHRSYLVNRRYISAYDGESVTVGAETLPRGKDVLDGDLKAYG